MISDLDNPFLRLAERKEALQESASYRYDPVRWVQTQLGEFLWSKQQEILRSVKDNRFTAVHACHDSSKSFTASRLVCWWLSTHEPGEAFVVSTAPTFSQVRAILWREIGRAHRKGQLPGRINQTEWFIGDEIVGYGRKPSDTDPAAFQGIHAKYVLVIIDEASGVPKALWDAVDTLATNIHARVLAIGNPDDPSSHFREVCKPGSGWNVIHIDGLETPNFTDEEVPDYLSDLLLSPAWEEERRERWGEDSPLYIAKVRGEFPEDAEDGVVPLSWVRRCQGETPPILDPLDVALGVDVGAGGDFTSIRERRGMSAGRVWRDHSNDPEKVVGKVLEAIRASGARRVCIDSIGIGWGIAGWLEERGRAGVHHAKIVRVNVGQASSDPKRFRRLRDQIWWEVGRELSEFKGWDLTQVDDDTIAQLIAPKYEPSAGGQIVVEPKDETKKRIGRSPDDADALLLAFFKGGDLGVTTYRDKRASAR